MSEVALVGLMPAPDGVIPDFDVKNMTATQRSFILAYAITLVLATLTLFTRIYTRLFIVRSFGLDDVAVLLSMGSSAAYFWISMELMKYGFGRHMWEVTASQMANYLKLLSPLVATYAWAPALTKLSILLLLHRLNPKFWFRIAVYTVAISIIAYTLTITLVIAYPCSPSAPNTGECLNNCGLWQAIFNIITDVAILILPLHMLHHLNLPFCQKIALGSIFSTGVFVIAICVVRITYVMSLQNNADVTYSQGRAAVWSSVELNVGILCNAVVVLKPLVRRHFPNLFASYGSGVVAQTPEAPRIIRRFPKFSESRVSKLTFPLSDIDNKSESRPTCVGDKDSIVVTNTYKIDTSKSKSGSTENLVAQRVVPWVQPK